MKTYQAKALKVGDRIIWSSQSQSEIGVVVERGIFSVNVRWPDGRISELYFNQMQNVERFSFDREVLFGRPHHGLRRATRRCPSTMGLASSASSHQRCSGVCSSALFGASAFLCATPKGQFSWLSAAGI